MYKNDELISDKANTLAKLLGGTISQAQEAKNQQALMQQKMQQEAENQKAMSVLQNQQELERQQALLSQKGAQEEAQRQRDIENMQSLRSLIGKDSKINVGHVTVDPRDVGALMALTPAQESAEKEAGKKIADYMGGGKQAGESNVGQIAGVQKDIQSGGRGMWDRTVGGALENHPTLMSFLAPQEKARRDAVQNAMLSMLHDAGIPRPTQWDIQRVFGQVYDPAAPDETNLARLQNAVGKIKAHNDAMEKQAQQYNQTGYATVGAKNAQSAAPSGNNSDLMQQINQRLQELDAKRAKSGK